MAGKVADKVNVFFEIETINRELDFRLFLASLFDRSGARFYIGRQDVMLDLVSENNNGLYIGKNIRPISEDVDTKRSHHYRLLKERGHKLIWLDEEGGVFWGERPEWEQMMIRSLDPTKLDVEDQVCVWGDLQREFYQDLNPPCRANIETTGHPRFDLYKPKYREYYALEANRLKAEYGDFLLVNTNFHRANTVEGLKKIFSKNMQHFTSGDRYYMLDRWLHINHVLTDFVRVLTTLSLEMPELNIVIRPHPSENVDFYRMVFSGAENVHVVQEGSVGKWLFAARAMMHDGCTTAIEGDMAGLPVINYKPVTDERFDIPLPNLFGVRCENEAQAVAMMRDILKGEPPREDAKIAQQKRELREATTPQFIANFPLESDAFAPLLEKMSIVIDTLPGSPPISAFKKEADRPAFGFLRSGKTGKSKKKSQLGEGMQAKFYGFYNADIPARIARIQKMLNKDVRCTIISDELLCIET